MADETTTGTGRMAEIVGRQVAQEDALAGAIDGLMHVVENLDRVYGNNNLGVQIGLALNEAYRNGLRDGRTERTVGLHFDGVGFEPRGGSPLMSDRED